MVEAPFRLVRGSAAGHVRAGLGPDRQHLLGARAARLAVQVGVRRRPSTRSRGCPRSIALEGRRARRDLQLRQPRLRPHARWSRARSPPRRETHGIGSGRGRRADHAGPRRDQAADRAGRGGRAGRLPVRPRRRRSSPAPPSPWTAAGRRAESDADARCRRCPAGRVPRTAGPGGRRRSSSRGRSSAAGPPAPDAATLEPSWSRPRSTALQGAGAAGAPAPARGRAVGAVRHRRRPGRAARPGRGAGGDRAPGPAAARHRRRLHDAARPRARRHLHAGDRRLGLGQVPRAAAGRWAPGSAGWWRRPPRRTRPPTTSTTRASATRTTSTTAVAEEGLVAILGVPLRLGSRVDRRAVRRQPERAAVRPGGGGRCSARWPRTRRWRSTTPGCCRRPRPRWRSCQRGQPARSGRTARPWSGPRAAHDRMTELVLRGGGVEDVAAVGDRGARRRAGRAGRDGRRLADRRRRRRAGRRASFERRPQASRGAGPHRAQGDCWSPRWTRAAEPLCTLVLRPDGDVADADQRILERAALVTALLLLFRRSGGRGRGPGPGRAARRPDLPARPRPGAAERARRLGRGPGRAARRGRGPARRAARAGRVLGRRPRRPCATAWRRRHGRRGGAAAARRRAPGASRSGSAAELSAALGRPATAGAAGPASGPTRSPPPTTRHGAAPTRCWRWAGRVTARAPAELGFVGLLGRRRPRRRGVRRLGARPGARLRRPPGHRPGAHARRLLRRGRPPVPYGRGRCTSTSTPSPSGWTGSASCSATAGRSRSGRWRSSSPCACTGWATQPPHRVWIRPHRGETRVGQS